MSFSHAPISKACLVSMCTASFLAGSFSRKYLFNVPLVPHLSRDHQIWRLVVHHLAFHNSTEVFLASLIIFSLSVNIERSFGSVKFASFIAVSALFTTFLELLALLVLYRLGLKAIPAGPFGLVFSLLYQYYRIVPSSYKFRIASMDFTNKVFVYFLAAQLFMSQPFVSAVPCICGLLAGSMYRADVLGLRAYRLPGPLIRVASKALLPIFGSSATQRPPRRGVHASLTDVPPPAGFASAFASGGATQAIRRGTPATTTDAGPAQPALAAWAEAFRAPGNAQPPAPPSAEAVRSLQAMFPDASQEAVTQALQATGNDVNRAVERLLTTS